MRPDLRLAPWSPPDGQRLPGLVVLFARYLRDAGVAADTAATTDAIRSTAHVDVADVVQFHRALQANLASRAQDLDPFDDAFAAFWLGAGPAHDQRAADGEPAPDAAGSPGGAGAEAGDVPQPASGDAARGEAGERMPDALAAGTERGRPQFDVEVQHALYSPDSALRERNFRELSEAERAEVLRAIERMPRLLELERARRYRRSLTMSRRIDFRRTFRATIAGGEPMPRWQQRRSAPERLVLLLDVSRSMDGYAEPLLGFARALCRTFRSAEAFLFSTSVARVTGALRSGDVADALALASAQEAARSTGTALGACLAEFHHQWGARGLGRRWVTLVASDGWDWGDPRLLAEQMGRIRDRSRVVLWLNPAMSDPRFRPVCAGMSAALPYVDALLPCHSLARLHDVARRLAALTEHPA